MWSALLELGDNKQTFYIFILCKIFQFSLTGRGCLVPITQVFSLVPKTSNWWTKLFVCCLVRIAILLFHLSSNVFKLGFLEFCTYSDVLHRSGWHNDTFTLRYGRGPLAEEELNPCLLTSKMFNTSTITQGMSVYPRI